MNEVLTPWHGASAMIWQFHCSHRRIAIRLYRPRERESLFIVGETCRHISGPFDWDDNRIEVLEAPPAADGATWLVRDTTAGFSLRCHLVGLVPDANGEFTLD